LGVDVVREAIRGGFCTGLSRFFYAVGRNIRAALLSLIAAIGSLAERTIMLRRFVSPCLVLAALAVSAAPATASVTDGYATPAGVSQTEVQGATNATTTTSTGNSQLPFTGFDLGLMLAGGVVLLGAGLGLARLTRRPPEPR
jgi:hypothetical protein